MWEWHSGWWWLVMTPLMVGFWVALAWVLISLTRRGGGSTGDAERILAERYARGELDGEEYRGRLDDLRRMTAPPVS